MEYSLSGALRKTASKAVILVCLLASTGANVQGQNAEPTQCAACHDYGPQLEKSAHAALKCNTCHDNHQEFPHPEDIAKPACNTCHQNQAEDYEGGVHGLARKKGNAAAPNCESCHGSAHELVSTHSPAFRTAVPDTCGSCHKEVAKQFRESVHGKALARGVSEAPLCSYCHGAHKILKHSNKASAVNQGNVRDTCGGCHGNVQLARKFGMPADRLVSFDSSFHGLAAKAGSQTVASCDSCHGIHNILPSSDVKSTIHPKNLSATCSQCHPGAGSRFAIGQVHLVEGKGEPASLRWVRWIYLVLISVTLGLMGLHNGGDWIRKLIRTRFAAPIPIGSVEPREGRGELRMLPFERVQHAALAISFCTLAWTGFALKYPDQWWAQPLLMMEGEWSFRSLVHRAAALVFMVAGVAHAASLIFNRKLREHWKTLLPKFRDVREGLSGFAYNVGLRSVPPVRSSHSYVEKVEYWAVAWGTIIMALTGILLWANNLALQFLPKIWLDVATSVHFYEAVLATAAIVIWHFYFAIFDPQVYPLDTAFLTGFSARKQPVGPAEPSPGKPAESPASGD
ncbi:MAG: cytochrome b/b6 domain-containing protein [Bryobacteraceae bacterium]|nr:cytochrome b/b6 domain-containing protein [Bryobacteraceae bacterium]